jgi:hypothetical protein
VGGCPHLGVAGQTVLPSASIGVFV